MERKFIDQRVASLAGAIGCIYVGGNSDVEQKEKFDRVDDSVCAVRSALEEGIVAGGGYALLKVSMEMLNKTDIYTYSRDQMTAFKIVTEAIQTPMEQILLNAGKTYDEINMIYKESFINDYGYDVKNEKFGDLFKSGVIDPLKVTKNALKNAASVATTILSTNAIITHARMGQL